MKCFNCGSEWNTNSSYSQLKSCPFCGRSLLVSNDNKEEMTVSEAIKAIIDQFGSDIILQKNKFLSIFGDYAPRLKKEKKMLSIALDENIACLFINCEISDHEAVVRKARRSLDTIMSESAINLVISSFADAFGWNVQEKAKDSIKTSEAVLDEDTYNIADYSFNSEMDFLHIVHDHIRKIRRSRDVFNEERYKMESSDSRFIDACEILNKGNYAAARKLFENLLHPNSKDHSKIGNSLAGVKLAQMFYWGEGGDVDKVEAARIMISLINSRNPLVFAWISDYYRVAISDVTIKDKEFSSIIFEICSEELATMADLGDEDAQYFLGSNLIYGLNCSKDVHKGFHYVKSSADSGNIHAIMLLSDCYFDGIGTEVNKKKGIKILLDLDSFECPQVKYKLGLLYYLDKYQDFVLKDYSKALKYILHAATSGHVSALDRAGDLYYYGKGSIKQSYSMAKTWYEQAAARGNIHSLSMLGTINCYGEGVDENEDLSFNYFKLAADNGNVYSQYMLHLFYFSDGKYKNYEMGRQYLEEAAEQGDADSQFLLARMYASDYGFNDDRKLVYWLRKAAEQGHSEAERFLGEAYIELKNNKVLPKNYTEAVKWLERAVQHDNVEAMVYLSELYSNVLVDPKKADQMASSAIKHIDNSQIEEDKSEELNERIAAVMLNIGNYYWNTKDKDLSFDYFQLAWCKSGACSSTNEMSSKMLAQCYKYGIGVKKDRKKAKLYSKLS